MIRRYLVVKEYQTPFGQPLIFRLGQRLNWEQRESEWPGWIWCSDQSNVSAWIPESWVQIDGKTCVLKRDYNARELLVQPGDVLQGSLMESGWLYAQAPDGREGWAPLNCLEEEK